MRTRALSLVAGVAAIGFASLFVASPAAADPATLPEGQQITIVEQIEGSPGGSRMWTVSPEDALATDNKEVQAPIDIVAIDVNDDGFGYATENRMVNGETREAYLWKADANTGVLSDPVLIVGEPGFEETISECDGLDLQPDGSIVLACTENLINGTPSNGFLGVVSTAGVLDVRFNSQSAEDVTLDFTAVAYNGVTGQLWAFIQNDPAAYPVDRSNDAAWVLGTIVPFESPSHVDGADFDRNGQLFITAVSEGTSLYTLDLTTGPPTFNWISEIFSETSAVTPVFAITVWGKPALPATGSAEILPIGLGTALLFLTGAAFIATGRIQRRTAAE